MATTSKVGATLKAAGFRKQDMYTTNRVRTGGTRNANRGIRLGTEGYVVTRDRIAGADVVIVTWQEATLGYLPIEQIVARRDEKFAAMTTALEAAGIKVLRVTDKWGDRLECR